MKHLVSVVLLVVVAAAAGAQTGDFEKLLGGKEYPHALKLKDLNADWKRVVIATPDASGGMGDMLSQIMQSAMMSGAAKGGQKGGGSEAAMGMAMLGGLFGGGLGGDNEPVYYTKGQTAIAGGETFLVCYKIEKPKTNFLEMAMQAGASGKEPDNSKLGEAGKLTPESPLAISLINVKTINGMSKIRPFDLNQEIADSAKAGGGLMDLINASMSSASKEPNPATPASKPSNPAKKKAP
jgi:hypothetical protein